MQKIFGVTGEIGSGKGALVNYLKVKHGAGAFSFSKILKDLLRVVCLEKNRKNLQKISTVLRKNFGEDLLAKAVYMKVNSCHNSLIVVDSIRRSADIKYLKKIKGFKLIYLEADMQKRFQRVSGRNEKSDDRAKKFSEFKKEQLAETELQIKKLKRQADFLIENNGSKKDFYQKIDKIFKNNKKSEKL